MPFIEPPPPPPVVAAPVLTAPLRLVDGGPRSPGSWVAITSDQLFVCWSPAPHCFERVVFDDDGLGVLVADLDLAFVDRGRLVAGTNGRAGYILDHGSKVLRAAATDDLARDLFSEVRLRRPENVTCHDAGPMPIFGPAGFDFAERPCPVVDANACFSAGPRLRAHPLGAEFLVGLGLDAQAWDRCQNTPEAMSCTHRAQTAWTFVVMLQIRIDPLLRRRQVRSLQDFKTGQVTRGALGVRPRASTSIDARSDTSTSAADPFEREQAMALARIRCAEVSSSFTSTRRRPPATTTRARHVS